MLFCCALGFCLQERAQGFSRLTAKAQSIAQRLSSSLVEPLWNVDAIQAGKVLEAELGDPDVETIVVHDSGGGTPGMFVERGRPSSSGTSYVSHYGQVRREGKLLAQIEIRINESGLRHRLFMHYVFVMLFAGVIWLLLMSLLQAAAKLLAAHERNEARSRARSDFLAAITPEIRTAVTGIVGMTDLLSEQEHSPETRSILSHIRHSAQSLLKIGDDLCDFMAIDAGRLELSSATVNTRTLIAGLRSAFVQQFSNKSVQLVLSIDPAVPETFQSDAQRLHQILLNLIGLSLRLAANGSRINVGIQVSQHPGAAADSGILLHFSVSETGSDTATRGLAHALEASSDEVGALTRWHNIESLELVIARRLVEMMGGAVWVQNAGAAGSVFHFTVRVQRSASRAEAASAQAAKREAPPSNLKGVQMLVVEDDPVNLRLAEALLTRAGVIVHCAASGEEGLDIFRARQGALGLVLLDLNLPQMSGFELAKSLRELEKKAEERHIPIVAMTARYADGETEECRSAGINDCLSKPFENTELLITLSRWIGR